MNKIILVLGKTGLIGNTLVRYLENSKDFKVFSTSRKLNGRDDEIYFDALEFDRFSEILKKTRSEVVVNCIGIVKAKVNGIKKAQTVYINSLLPHKLAAECIKNNSKLIHISTDCVFSGKEGNYSEASDYSPIDFYGLSKATGEIIDDHNLTIRTSVIGNEKKKKPTGLMEWFFSQEGKNVKGFKNAIWSGLTTLELSKKIVEMHEKNVTGLINIVSGPISKHDLLCLIKKIYNLNIEIIPDSEFNCNRSMTSIRKEVSYQVPSHSRMLKELKEWEKINFP